MDKPFDRGPAATTLGFPAVPAVAAAPLFRSNLARGSLGCAPRGEPGLDPQGGGVPALPPVSPRDGELLHPLPGPRSPATERWSAGHAALSAGHRAVTIVCWENGLLAEFTEPHAGKICASGE